MDPCQSNLFPLYSPKLVCMFQKRKNSKVQIKVLYYTFMKDLYGDRLLHKKNDNKMVDSVLYLNIFVVVVVICACVSMFVDNRPTNVSKIGSKKKIYHRKIQKVRCFDFKVSENPFLLSFIHVYLHFVNIFHVIFFFFFVTRVRRAKTCTREKNI